MPIINPKESLTKPNSKAPITLNEIQRTQTYRALFVGPHMMKKVVQKSGKKHGITAFTVPIQTCLHCRATVNPKKTFQGHCKQCVSHIDGTTKVLNEEWQHLQRQRKTAWETCMRCIKATEYSEQVPCANNDCDNFYQRDKVMMDIEDLGKKMEKLNK